MPNTNIQLINYSDDQSQIIDKLNNNFDEVIELHGGTRGTVGPTGDDGAIGERGSVGATGFDGTRGTRWFVSGSIPSGTFAQEGDYWINSGSSDIYTLTSSGWNLTGYNLRTAGSLFSSVNSAYVAGSGRAIQIDQVLPKNYLFVLADVAPESQVLNELLSKFTISTDSLVNDSPLLEFSRSDLETGNVADYSLHPVFYWPSPVPSDNSLGFRVPGGNLLMGVTGGFGASFDDLNIESQKGVTINYGATSSGSIFATGGYSFVTPTEFNVLSKNVSITGGTASFFDPINSEITGDSATPHTTITAGTQTSAFISMRTGDIQSKLSPTVYHLNLESSTDSELSLSTNGKLRTKKTTEGLSYSANTPSYQVQNGATSWFFISRTSTPYTVSLPSSILENGNTIIINPAVLTDTFVGIGFYSGSDYSWGGPNGLKPGESIDIRVYNSSDSNTRVNGFKYIGVGTGGTGGTAATKVTLPFHARSIDFTLTKGPTGTTVNWRTYAPWPSATVGGTGGSFIY